MPGQEFISALEAQFPHIAERTVYFWDAPEFYGFINGLLTTDVPGRQGFPMEVATELLFLEEVHDLLYPREAPPWTYS